MTDTLKSPDTPPKGRETPAGPGVLIGETRALDPETRQPCPARIVERDGAVFLEKTLNSGKVKHIMVERDAAFYRRFADADMTGRHRIQNNFFYVTSRCNLKCPVCYEGKRQIKEPSLEMLCAKLPKMNGHRVALCGAEPTCRDDLPNLIRAINRRHAPILMTNGLKLADMKYLRSLREAGLDHVVFSMNGLNEEVFHRINGQALLDVKLQALENMEKLNMHVALSATITRGVNEDQIKPLLDLEKQHRSICQVRIRSMAEVGDYVEGSQFCMSELVKLVFKQGGIDYEMWLKQQDFYDQLGRAFGIDYLRPRLCAMRADLDQDLVPLLADRTRQEWEETVMKKPRLVAKLLQSFGLKYAFQYLLSQTTGYRGLPYPEFRFVTMRVWPTLDTMDLNLNKRCSSVYHREGDALPFCLSNVLSNE